MTADLRDPIHDALEGLRPDVDRLSLHPAYDVRRRGDARTRHQRAALVGVTAVTVAAVALGAGVLGPGRRTGQPVAPATGTSATAGPSTSAAPTPTEVTTDADIPMDPPHGAPDAYFLPAAQWAGADLGGGATPRWQQLKDPEAIVQNGACDPDGVADGVVGLAQLVDPSSGQPLAQQKVRVHPSRAAAEKGFGRVVAAIGSCQKRLDVIPGNNVRVTVTRDDTASSSSDAGSVAVFRVDVGLRDGTTPDGTEWTAVLWDGGTTVSTIMVNEPPADTDGRSAIRRIARAAARQLAAVRAT